MTKGEKNYYYLRTMFTGIITEVSTVTSILHKPTGAILEIRRPPGYNDLVIGESISVDGACLTVTEFSDKFIKFDVSAETVKRTILKEYIPNRTQVNLERALKVGDRLGGHIVQGHVDTTTEITRIEPSGDGYVIYFKNGNEFLIVEKGSVAVNGISLTVMGTNSREFWVSVLKFTFENTNLKLKKPKDRVNIEFDIIGKYVLNLTRGREYEKSGLTEEKLKDLGFY